VQDTFKNYRLQIYQLVPAPASGPSRSRDHVLLISASKNTNLNSLNPFSSPALYVTPPYIPISCLLCRPVLSLWTRNSRLNWWSIGLRNTRKRKRLLTKCRFIDAPAYQIIIRTLLNEIVLQRSTQLQTDKKEPAFDHSKLNDLIASLQSESNKRQALQDDLRQQLATADKEKQELLRQISNAGVENAGLAHQVSAHLHTSTQRDILILTHPA
jgi:hypothetical protein